PGPIPEARERSADSLVRVRRGFLGENRADMAVRAPSGIRSALGRRGSSRIVARAVASDVTRRKCFSRQNPPPYVGGYHSRTHLLGCPWLHAKAGARTRAACS